MKEIEFGVWEVPIKGATQTGIAKFHPGPGVLPGEAELVWLSIGIGWVVFGFTDFEQMYNLAKAARENDD